MTVEELITELETFDPDAIVKFTYPSGNHTQDEIACSPYSVEEGNVIYSDYCQAYITMSEEYEEKYVTDEEDEEKVIRNICLIM
jgi:hypothetical protein